MKISMTQCKKRLAIIWFTGSGVIFFIIFFQVIFGHYGENVSEVWSWALPTIMPTLSLAISALVMDATGKSVVIPKIDVFLYRLTCGLSIAYLVSVLLIFLLQPFTSVPVLHLMHQSNLWLGPFQGLVAAGMGAFFVTSQAEK